MAAAGRLPQAQAQLPEGSGGFGFALVVPSFNEVAPQHSRWDDSAPGRGDSEMQIAVTTCVSRPLPSFPKSWEQDNSSRNR